MASPLGALRSFSFSVYERSYIQGLRLSRFALPLGRYVAALGAATLAMSADFSQPATPYVASLCLGILLAGYLANRLRKTPKLRFSRDLPARAFEGEHFEYSISVSNFGSAPSPYLDVRDHAKLRFPSALDWLRRKAPFEERLNAFDRWSGYAKWLWLLERGQDALAPDFPLPPIPPGATATLRAEAISFRRGERLFLGFYCGMPDPLGMTRRMFFSRQRQSISILPKPKPFPLAMPFGSRSRQSGDRPLDKTADSEEFRSLREWRRGDPLKRIDWRATARAGSPIVREYSPEYLTRNAIAIDTFAPEADEDRSDEIARRAAGLLLRMDRKEAIVDLAFVDGTPHHLEMFRGSKDPRAALDILASLRDSSSDQIADLRGALIERAGSFSSVAMILACWDEPRAALARELSSMGVGVCALVLSSPSSTPFPPGVSGMFLRESEWGC